MIDHLDAFRAALTGSGYPVFDLTVSDTARPPWLLLGYQAMPPEAEAMGRAKRHLEFPVFVTYTAGTPYGVLEILSEIRALLEGKRLIVAGRNVHPLRVDSYAGVTVDQDATIPGTSIRPAFAIDTWTIASTPLLGDQS